MMLRERLTRFQYWPQSITALIVVFFFVGYRYIAYYDTQSTDAEVAAQRFVVSPAVTGPVLRVHVRDNQMVKKGDKLLEIDNSPYAFALEQEKANYQKIKNTVNNDQSFSHELLAARAALDLAQYHYDQTTLYAPVDGLVSVVHVNPGQYLAAGQTAVTIIDSEHYWIEARYRETAIRLIKPGDKATIRLSMYPGMVFQGHVDKIDWGTAALQSTREDLTRQPAQDWIKVAKRIPVRILMDDKHHKYPMYAGTSATTTTHR